MFGYVVCNNDLETGWQFQYFEQYRTALNNVHQPENCKQKKKRFEEHKTTRPPIGTVCSVIDEHPSMQP